MVIGGKEFPSVLSAGIWRGLVPLVQRWPRLGEAASPEMMHNEGILHVSRCRREWTWHRLGALISPSRAVAVFESSERGSTMASLLALATVLRLCLPTRLVAFQSVAASSTEASCHRARRRIGRGRGIGPNPTYILCRPSALALPCDKGSFIGVGYCWI